MNFGALIPDKIMTDTLGDDVTYHAKAGPLAIRVMVSRGVDNVFSGDAYVTENRLRVDVAIADAPGLKKGSKFTINGTKYIVDAIIADDGYFASCLVR